MISKQKGQRKRHRSKLKKDKTAINYLSFLTSTAHKPAMISNATSSGN